MRKTVLAAVAWASAFVLPSAHAYGFEATWNIVDLSCTSSDAWQGCADIDTTKPNTVFLRVDDYTPTPAGFASTVTIGDSLSGNTGRGPIGILGSRLHATSFLSSQDGHSLTFQLASLTDFTPQSLARSLATGDFAYHFGHSYYTGTVNGDVKLIGWKDTTLAPVPEPHTYALLLAGLGVMGWVARGRRRAG